jgi:hypothetical protein
MLPDAAPEASRLTAPVKILLFASLLLAAAGASADSVEATRIRNKDAPVIDGALDPIWKKSVPLKLPSDAGNYYKFGAKDVMKMEGDVESGGALYRPQRPFTIQEQRYSDTDPSSYAVYFLHDDLNLYVAVACDDDQFIESSEYDQTSDAFGLGLKTKDSKIQKYWLTWFRGKSTAPGTTARTATRDSSSSFISPSKHSAGTRPATRFPPTSSSPTTIKIQKSPTMRPKRNS